MARDRPNLVMLRLRVEKGMSRAALADAAGVSVKQIGLIERGLARRSREATLKGIADALDTNVLTVFPERGRRP